MLHFDCHSFWVPFYPNCPYRYRHDPYVDRICQYDHHHQIYHLTVFCRRSGRFDFSHFDHSSIDYCRHSDCLNDYYHSDRFADDCCPHSGHSAGYCRKIYPDSLQICRSANDFHRYAIDSIRSSVDHHVDGFRRSHCCTNVRSDHCAIDGLLHLDEFAVSVDSAICLIDGSRHFCFLFPPWRWPSICANRVQGIHLVDCAAVSLAGTSILHKLSRPPSCVCIYSGRDYN